MCTPAAQPYGSDDLIDDEGIGDDDRVVRHCRTPVQIVDDRLTGGKRISSQAFKPKPGETCSVDLECLLIQAGHDALYRAGEMPNTHAMIAIEAGLLRAQGKGVAHTPKPAGETPVNPFHGDILGLGKKGGRELVDVSVVLAISEVPFEAPLREAHH